MSLSRAFVLGVVLFSFAGFAAAEEKISAEKAVGTWKVEKSSGVPPVGAMIDFKKDGKFVMTFKNGEETTNIDGKYKVEGAKLTISMTMGDQKQEFTVQIKKLTDTKFETLDDQKNTVELSKVKK